LLKWLKKHGEIRFNISTLFNNCIDLIFAGFGRRFQLKIKNREAAGNILAQTLKAGIKKEDRKDTTIVGLPRGGLLIAEIIAQKLSCPLNLIISRRLRAPYNDELAIGSVTEDGTTYMNELVVNDLKISQDYINNELSHQLAEIKRLVHEYIPEERTFLDRICNICDRKTIVIVDDGAATGSTIISTVRCLRKNTKRHRLVVAIPVSPKRTVDLLRNEDIDNLEVITSPQDSNFGSIEQYYQNFDQVTDKQVLDIIQRSIRK
jgi:putative phosphoribosyl transferase